MAGGIDWFRWHHGSVTDPKFQLVARKAGASLPDVLAVWAYMLEQASAAEKRGEFGAIDCDALDCLFAFPDGRTLEIFEAMKVRGLHDGAGITAWEKRQPKREDDTAAERKRRQREREHELQMAERVTGSESRNVTQGHAEVTHGHDRGEERREEEKEEPKTKTARKRAAPAVLVSVDNLVEAGVEKQHAADWLAVRKVKNLPLTATAWADTQAEAVKAGLSIGEAIKKAAGEGWAGFKASWLAQEAPRSREPPITVPGTDKRADEFLADQEARAKAASRPPAAILELAGRVGRMTA